MVRIPNIGKYAAILMAVTLCGLGNVNAQVASFTVAPGACANLPQFNFTNTSTGAVSYCWDFSYNGTTPNDESNVVDPTFVYPLNTPGTYTILLTACDAANCGGNCDTASVTVEVWALPTANFIPDGNEGCAPYQVCFTDGSSQGSAPISTWNWNFGDGSFSTAQSPCYSYPLTAAGFNTVNLSVTDDNGCTDSIDVLNLVEVHIPPTANFNYTPSYPGTLIACNPNEPVTTNDLSTPGDGTINQWDWNFPGGSPATGTGSSATTSYAAAGTYLIDLYVTDDNGCVDTMQQTAVVDDFAANIGFTSTNVEGCGQLIVTFIDTTSSFSGQANPWVGAWDFSYDGTTFNTESVFGPNVGNYYATPGTYTVAMAMENAAGCQDTAYNTTMITVHELPSVGFEADTLVACDYPFTVTFTDTTGGAASWIWDIDNATVPPTPPGNDWSTDYTTQTFSHTYTDTGCYNVSVIVTDTNGCVDTAKYDDFICISEPVAEFIADTIMDTSDIQLPLIAKGCVPLKVHFLDLSTYDTTYITDSIVTWYWDFGDGYTIIGGDSAIADSTNDCLTYCTYPNPTHIYVDTGNFTVTLVITTSLGCDDTITMDETFMCQFLGGPCTVDAGMVPIADFRVNDTVGCHPFSVEFTDLSSSYANEWSWDFGDDGTDQQQNPPYTYSQDIGFFDVWEIAIFNGCNSDTMFYDSLIEVLAPRPEFSVKTFKDSMWTGDTHFCFEDTLLTGGWKVQIRDTSQGPPDIWVWDLDDENTINTPNPSSIFDSTFVVWRNDTTFLYLGIDSIFTVNYDTLFVDADTVIFPVDTFFFKAGDTITCDTTFFVVNPGDTLYMDADSVPPNPPTEDKQIQGDVVHWFGMQCDTLIITTGDTLVIYNHCIIPVMDTNIVETYRIVMSEVYDTVQQASADTFGCATEIIEILDVDTIPTYNILTPYWEDTLCFGPTDSIITIPVATPFQPDTICITRRSPITDTTSTQIVIGGVDTFNIEWAQIITDTTTYIFPADTNFFGLDTVPPDTTAPDTNFVAADTISSGLCDTIFIPADTIVDPPDTVITAERIKAKPFVHTYYTPGTKTVWLYEWRVCPSCPDSLCLDSTFVDVFISKIDADFTINQLTGGDTADCSPGSFFFEDNTTMIYDSIQRIWDFGDGFILVSPTFPFLDIPVPPGEHPSSCQPGGSTTGSYKQVNHVYCDSGTYDVKMVIIDQFGCRDSIVKQVYVYPNPAPAFVADTLSGCANDPIQVNLEVVFSDTVTHPYQIEYYIWNYGDGTGNDTSCSWMTEPHTYNVCGTFPVTLTTIDVNGCQNTNPVNSLFISTTCPIANFVPSAQAVCSATPLTFISTSTGGAAPLTYTWDWCDSTSLDVTTNTSATHTFNVDTTTDFTVTLTVEDANGCRDTASYTVTIEQPVADFYGFFIDTLTNCPNIFQFEDSSSADVTNWTWDFGDGSPISFLPPPVQNTYVLPGLYTVILTVTNSSGCTDVDTVVDYVNIRGPILISATQIDTGNCAPYPVIFTATGYNTDSYQWVFGDGTDTTVVTNADPANPDTTTVTVTHIYTQGGDFLPVLIITDPLDSAGQSCPYPFTLDSIHVPGPRIGYFTNDTICGPRDVMFTDTSLLTQDVDFYWWDFGDGHFIGPGIDAIPAGTDGGLSFGDYNSPVGGPFTGPTHTYEDEGVFTVTFGAYVIDGTDTCKYQVATQQIVVFGMSLADTVACPDWTGTWDASGITVDTADLSYNLDSLLWDFGDGSATETGYSVSHTYVAPTPPDTLNYTWYDITVTFGPTCSFVVGQAGVAPTPNADFTIDPSISGISVFVSLTNTSTGADSMVIWDFDDASFSETYWSPAGGGSYGNTAHTYVDSGTYNIQLIGCNKGGCCDTTIIPKHILIKIPNVFNPGSATPENAVFYIGDFFMDTLDLSTSVLRLEVFNRWGEQVYLNENYQECDPFGSPDLCWDGHDMKGNELGTDTYFYVLSLNRQAAVNGYVMLLRPN